MVLIFQEKKSLGYVNRRAESLKIPIGFGIFMEKKNHKSGLIIDLLVKHLLVYDPKQWVSGNGDKEISFWLIFSNNSLLPISGLISLSSSLFLIHNFSHSISFCPSYVWFLVVG